MKILYFTSTGNNLHISKKLGGELLSIPQLIKNNTYEITDDTIGIIVPVYYGSVPIIVREYLKKATLNAEYLFCIISYGSSYAGAFNDFEKIFKKKGQKINYTNDVKMVDNFTPMFSMDEEIKIKDTKEIDKKIDFIKQDIENHKESKINITTKDAITTKFMDKIFRPVVSKWIKIKVKDGCNDCETCSKVCPQNNITVQQGPNIGKNCILCLACVQNCPKNIIYTSKQKDDSRFRNPNVKLSEIIKSNQQ